MERFQLMACQQSPCQLLVKIAKATIDTGFNGDLELPESLRKSLNAHYVGQATSALAGGQTIEELFI